ncbi:MAG: YidC/Oxa1 family membrane protein insertase [Clostridia bacterium]|nr:YidC/Oxa1 family membrane protein insertase [Clostridia bacterium]
MSGILNFSAPSAGSFLVEIIIWLVKISSSIALGIVLFTLLLKLITLPFDFMSRASMRKNSLKMEEMRPELEKLQKQYADNKDLYNQKMMALYKKNGYSMFGACLPTILTLVIFIVALNSFTDYSKYQNKMDFYHMSQSYNNVIYSGLDIDESENAYIIRNEKDELVVNDDALYQSLASISPLQGEKADGTTFDIIVRSESVTVNLEDSTKSTFKMTVTTTNGYVQYIRYFSNELNPVWGNIEYKVSDNAATNISYISENTPLLASEENNELKNSAGDTFAVAYEKEIERITQLNEQNKDTEGWVNLVIPTESEYVDAFINDIQSVMSAERYREEQASFLWIRNIWVTDSPMKHAVESSWSTFKSTHSYSGYDIGKDGYKKLIAHLDEETTAPNGYFILVILTAAVSLVSQIVMGKTQKAQMELQTVDGQGAQTQKMMKWMMPIMMAIFAFMYTSAFSIYIILSSTLSLGTTFLINAIVDNKFKKEKAKETNETVRGRVYVPKKEEVKEEKKVDKKKKDQTDSGDFLSGTADKKKHVRGRIK